MSRFSTAVVSALFVSSFAFADHAKLTLHCTEAEPGYGYPAIVNIYEIGGQKRGAVYPHSYSDTSEPYEAELTRIDQNGPETWFYGADFELRYDPTVQEATFFKNGVTGEIELTCEPR